MDECKHGLPQFICRRCDGNDRRDPGILSGLADEVNEVDDEPISVAEHKIFETIVAATEVNDPLEWAEKTAENITSAKRAPTVLPCGHTEAGKCGEGGVVRIRMLSSSRLFFRTCPKVPLQPYARSPATRI